MTPTIWPNQMIIGITVHLVIFCCHPFVLIILQGQVVNRCNEHVCFCKSLGRSSSLIWRSLGIHGWSDRSLKETWKTSHVQIQNSNRMIHKMVLCFFFHFILARNVSHRFMLLGSRSKDSLHPQCSAALLIERFCTKKRDVVVSE